MNRHLWPGISVGRDTADKSIDETINEIMIDRGMQPESKGVIHWSISSVTKNPRLSDTLIKSIYKKQALVPASPWLDNKAPASPSVTTILQNDLWKISWTHPDEKDVFHWVIYYQYGNTWTYQVCNHLVRSLQLEQTKGTGVLQQNLRSVIVTAVDRTGNESEKLVVVIK
jgi:hypothetical protein